MVIYILTKFGADWLTFIDARVLTRKLWTDGRTSDGHRRTVSDHTSSLSTKHGELKMEERFFKRAENTVEKEKLLVTSNISFSSSVFKRLILQTRKNQSLFGKGLKIQFDFGNICTERVLHRSQTDATVQISQRARIRCYE